MSQSRNILLDVSRLIWRVSSGRLPTGIDRVCLAYARHYADRSLAVVQRRGFRRVLGVEASRRLFDLLLRPTQSFRRKAAWIIARSLVSGSAVVRGHHYLYMNVGHTGLDLPDLNAWLDRLGARPVCMVHDLIPVTHPELCRPGERDKHAWRMGNMLRSGAAIIANSAATLEALETFARTEALTVPNSVVAPLGHLEDSVAPGTVQAASPYFLMVGTIEARKNHLMLMNIWRDMTARLGPATPRLIVLGQRGWECEQVIDMLERCEAIRGHVIELPRCSDAELTGYLKGARALLFPSFVEGYGMPLIEALALGVPVIASDIPVFRELAGNVPDYLSPIDGSGWMAAIEDYARTDSPRRGAQVARIAGYAAPNWADHFRIVDNWLDGLHR